MDEEPPPAPAPSACPDQEVPNVQDVEEDSDMDQVDATDHQDEQDPEKLDDHTPLDRDSGNEEGGSSAAEEAFAQPAQVEDLESQNVVDIA